jgi:hypothetical protein
MIYAAKFTGRKLYASGIMYPISTHCYGDNEEAARIGLYDRYQNIMGLKLELRPIVTVGECKVGDSIYRVENERLVGHITPHESAYQVCEKSDIVCSGAYANHITCRNSAGILVPVAADMQCIVTPA